MNDDLSLTFEEFSALGEASRGIAQGPIPQEHIERLIALGYVIRRLGTISLTLAGSRRFANGH